MTPVLGTRRLFARLLRTFDIGTVCDVGSMDGADAGLFRRRLADASILALEPNPANYSRMRNDESLREQRIQVLPYAASDREADAPFYLVKADTSESDRLRRGMSSLHRRGPQYPLSDVVHVRTVRLDRLLEQERLAGPPLALWIDAEGMGYEVIRGAEGVLAHTALLHVEVETTPCIGAGQRLFGDVQHLLESHGFVFLASDQPVDREQFNALYVRHDLLRSHAAPVRAWMALEWLRAMAAALARRILPPRVLTALRSSTVRQVVWP